MLFKALVYRESVKKTLNAWKVLIFCSVPVLTATNPALISPLELNEKSRTEREKERFKECRMQLLFLFFGWEKKIKFFFWIVSEK